MVTIMKSEAPTHGPVEGLAVKVNVTVPNAISPAEGVQVVLRFDAFPKVPNPLLAQVDVVTPVPDLEPANETIEPAHIV